MQNKIILPDARLAFSSLFKTSVFHGQDTGKFSATFLIPKDTGQELHDKLTAAIAACVAEAKIKPTHPSCLTDGDATGYENFCGSWAVKASNRHQPQVFTSDGKLVTSADESPVYDGCWVNGIITLWVQNNSYGKRINANLQGVQFTADGEAFGAPVPDVQDLVKDLGPVPADTLGL